MSGKTVFAVLLLFCSASWAAAGEGEKEAIAAIQKLGGKVHRASAQADAPVIGVVFRQKPNLKGEDLRHLSHLKDLEYLIFWTARVEGEGLQHLKGLKKLHTLSLGFTNFTSKKTWDDLKELTQLKRVGMG